MMHKRGPQRYFPNQTRARCGRPTRDAQTAWRWNAVTCKQCLEHGPLMEAFGWWFRSQWDESQIPRPHYIALREHEAIEYDASEDCYRLSQVGKDLMISAGYTEDEYGIIRRRALATQVDTHK